MNRIVIHTEYITLAQFLKYCGAVQTGGEASDAVRAGDVTVDGEVCYMRGKKLRGGEVVGIDGETYQVASS